MDYCDSEKILGALPPGIQLRMVKSRERFFLGLARKEKIIIIKHIQSILPNKGQFSSQKDFPIVLFHLQVRHFYHCSPL